MNTGLQFATHKEAVPFLKNYVFDNIQEKPFPVYKKGPTYIIISGIGKVNAAIAASFIITEYNMGKMINLGSAGSLEDKYRIGDILHIDKSTEYDNRNSENPRHKTVVPDILDGYPLASLVTCNSPVISNEDRRKASEFGDLVDMEGAAFVEACRAFSTDAYIFKVVSDIPGNTDLKDIIENIKGTRDILFRYIDEKLGSSLKF